MAKLTQKEVAKQLGVTQGTISRVLNCPDRAKVSPETRLRILQFYRNHMPEALPSPLNSAIMVLAHEDGLQQRTWWLRVITGIERKAVEKGRAVIFRQWIDEANLGDVMGGGISGIIHLRSLPKSTIRLIQSRMPLVVVSNSALDARLCDTVGIDNRAGIQMAVTYLVEAGHRHIAYLSMAEGRITDMPDRLDGYRNGLQAHGLTLADDLIIEDTNWPWHRPGAMEKVHEVLTRLRQRRPAPTAIVCYNDELALHLLKAAAEQGIAVPGELSVVGFDNIDACRFATPPLTSITHNREGLGREAVRLLMDRIESGNGSQDYLKSLLVPRLVERHSVGPANA